MVVPGRDIPESVAIHDVVNYESFASQCFEHESKVNAVIRQDGNLEFLGTPFETAFAVCLTPQAGKGETAGKTRLKIKLCELVVREESGLYGADACHYAQASFKISSTIWIRSPIQRITGFQPSGCHATVAASIPEQNEA